MRKFAAFLAALSVVIPVALVSAETSAGASTTYLCKSASYACTSGGYTARTAAHSGWAWRFYGGSIPHYNAYGPHNCTLYAAFRLERQGIVLNWHGDGDQWASLAREHGATVNAQPAVGAIAEWNSNHVAYVERVLPHAIIISDDNWSGAYTTRQLLTKSGNWPSAFIHFARPTVSLSVALARPVVHVAHMLKAFRLR